MSTWYSKIVRKSDDLETIVLDACDYFDAQCQEATKEVDMKLLHGIRVAEFAKRLPGIIGHRFHQLQELEAILGYLEIREIAITGARRRHYIEHYNRALTPTTAEKYAEADDAVLAIATLRNQIALTRNNFLALTKQHEYLHFQLGNITKLLAAGVDDAIL